jgi:aminoglycoside phosphotransferase (APT) family kinase protein
MHDDELDIDEGLVRRLLAEQFPQWADLAIKPVLPWGTDNAIFRLGDDLVARLPRSGNGWGVTQVHKESRWLPVFAPHLPLAVPVPLHIGKPAADYPKEWSVHEWLAGDRATVDRLSDLTAAAVDLARFIKALQSIDTTDGPPAGRGRPLAPRDKDVRAGIAALGDLIDADEATAAWEAALLAPEWDGPPVWLHGDLTSGNLLARDGRLTAVIDWSPGIGDPAVETIAAWNLFSGESRKAFRAELGVDDATWARGRGWALSIALVALPYYLETYPGIVADSWLVLDEVLAEHRLGLV